MTAAATAVEPQSTRPIENVKRDGATSNPTPAAALARATAKTPASAPAVDSLAPTANPPEKKKIKTKDAVLGCGCLTVLIVFLLPAIHAARESARKNSSSREARSSTEHSRKTPPNSITVDTSKLSDEARKYLDGAAGIVFEPNSLEGTALWAGTRTDQISRARGSGNKLVADEVERAVKEEIDKLKGTQVVWQTTVDHVTDRYVILTAATPSTPESRFFQFRVEGQPDDISLGSSPRVAIGNNVGRARKLTTGSPILITAKLVGVNLSGFREATLANLAFADE
jgi:hypothetical protein